jgi:transposase InsO family protein
MDSGASSHMTSDDGILLSRHLPSHPSITVGNGASLPVTHHGLSALRADSSTFPLNNVLVVPSLIHNLLSDRQFTCDNSCSIEFDAFGFSVKDIRTRRVILRCNSSGDLYTISVAASTNHVAPHGALVTSSTLWHHRLGHPNSAAITTLRNNSHISCNKIASNSLCHACQLGKHVRLPFARSSSHTSTPFELIHCDVWTSPVLSISGSRYYLVLIDDFSHYCWLFPLKCKYDVRHHIVSFLAYTKNQFQLSVKAIQADNGREFVNHALTSILDSFGILLRLSCPYTSPQNGKAERAIRTINNVCRTLLIHAHMTPPYWAEAALTTAYLLNRRPCSAIRNSIPFEHLFNQPPAFNSLRVFGCLCYPNLTATTSHKYGAPLHRLCFHRLSHLP